MPFELMKNEILQEIQAVQNFIEIAIEAQKNGYTKAATFFLSEAKEDCEHAFLYAREIDKYAEKQSSKSILDITKEYVDMEVGAMDRISAIYKKASSTETRSLLPFLSKMMQLHSEDAYRAKKLIQKIEILFASDALSDIETLFEEEHDED